MSNKQNAPHAEYPTPIGVLTSTLVGYKEDDPYQIVLVELQHPGVVGEDLVLPGGIFDVGAGKHRSQRTVVDHETLEETGLQFAPGHRPEHFAISQRLDVDPRRWCSFPTINGANDYILACPLVGEIKPRDVQEVRRAYWQDVRSAPLDRIGRGHRLIVTLWQTICDCGGLREALLNPDCQARIEALSDERHLVCMSDLSRMIYLEDQVAVHDRRE